MNFAKSVEFKQGMNPNQEFLLPKKSSDFLPEGHLARAVYEIVGLLDLENIRNKYSQRGQHAYDPRTMVRLLFYGYCTGVRSSRKISQGCEERFDFVYLTDNLKPSHDRVSDFRKDNLQELKDIFRDIVLIGANLGLVKLGNIRVSIDGSKVKANASPKLTKNERGLEKLMVKIESEISQIFEEAKRVDEEEHQKYGNARGDELPEKLRERKSRLNAIREAHELLKRQKEEAAKNVREEKQREPTQKEMKKIEAMKINVTDTDAKFMKERNGVIRPNYNVQLSVDEEEQFILANNVTDECNDHHQLAPMLRQAEQNIGERPKQAKADSGYLAQLEEAARMFPETEFLIDDKNRRKNPDMEKIKKTYSVVRLENLERLMTNEGEDKYKKRMHTVEPVIGNIKSNLGYRNFLLRGLSKARGEFNLMCIAHNLKKIVNFIKKSGLSLAEAIENFAMKRANETFAPRIPG